MIMNTSRNSAKSYNHVTLKHKAFPRLNTCYVPMHCTGCRRFKTKQNKTGEEERIPDC